MAALVFTQGLQRIADTASHTAGYASARFIQTMSVDDSSTAFAAGNTALNSGGAVANEFDQAFDATPTRSGQTVSHVMTIPLASAIFTIRRIALHDDTAATVLSSTSTIVCGIDGQSLTKTADFTLTFTVTVTYA